MTKGQLGYNLSKRPVFRSSIEHDCLGRPFYKRFSLNRIFTIINPEHKNVCSVRGYHSKELKKEIENAKNKREKRNFHERKCSKFR